jgi:phage portal protein BeeE
MAHAGRDICRIFGVDPAWVGLGGGGSSLTYQNLADRLTSFMASTMNAELVLIQEVLTANVPRPQFVRFATGAFLRSDLPTRYASYATALSSGFLTVDEVRELEDRGPLPDSPATFGGAPGA